MDIRAAYIHFPFCIHKCPYCDFVSFEKREDKIDEYVLALCQEIQVVSQDKMDRSFPLQTIYFGGGTPSLIMPDHIAAIMQKLAVCFGIDDHAEITLEANPGTVSLDTLAAYHAAGVNRLSLGIQSFSDPILKRIGRIHDSKQSLLSISDARKAGFENISCDLMTGLPGQTLDDAMESLAILLASGVPHISHYALTLEEDTKFYDMYCKHEELLPDSETEREMYHQMIRKLSSSGYHHYEISNCALPGYESRHNVNYWKANPYYGFGVGAHAYRKNCRLGNTTDLDKYLHIMRSPVVSTDEWIDSCEVITSDESEREYMLLSFRLMEGVSEEEFFGRYGKRMESIFTKELTGLTRKGLIESEKNHYFLTQKGLDFANEVFREFV